MADMSPTEVMALARDGDGLGNSWLGMIIVLFFLVYGMNGTWNNQGFNNAIGYENLATSAEVQRGFDNQNSMSNQREILAAVNAGTMQGVQTTNQVFHDTIGALSDKYQELQRDIAGLAIGQANQLAKANDCCCAIQRAIDGVNYNTAMGLNDAVQKLSDKIQGVSNQIAGNRMADMQNQINQLQLDQAMQGVVRYPNLFAYNAGNNPFCGCGNGYYNNI